MKEIFATAHSAYSATIAMEDSLGQIIIEKLTDWTKILSE
jgi:hypothetical protein